MTAIREIHDWNDDYLGKDIESFLENLSKPSWLMFEGKDASRTRVLTTLLHGNEPSGARALHRFLSDGLQPATNIAVFIGSVDAALREPKFNHRFLPEAEDLNRAFSPPFNTKTRQIAKALMDLIEKTQPEALIDLHNTSGSSVGFSIAVEDCIENEALASLFTQRLIIAHLKLGSLMEFASSVCPCITVECGGIEDKLSDITAYEGIKHFWLSENVLKPLDGVHPQKIFNPMRLELKKECSVGFSSSFSTQWDVTMGLDVEQYNYKILEPGHAIGWLGARGLDALQVICGGVHHQTDEYFSLEGNCLSAKVPLKLFMVTTNPKIAQADCLFYLVAQDNSPTS